jgi:protein involved in polysaccharide export with SLBB domain
MSTIKHPTLGSYVLPPLDLSSINIAPLTTDSVSSMSANSIPNLPTITLGGHGGGGGTGYYNASTYSNGVTGIGSANITWSNPSVNYNSPNISITPNIYSNTMQTGGTIQVKGDAEFEGKIKVGGKDLGELLSKIEDKLAIYKPNPELEEKWEELRELSKRYKELETEIMEKEKVWDILKK